jgi:hypothetical protein
MTLAMIAASAVLASVGQPKPPSVTFTASCERVYQMMILPGGGVFPMPVPLVVMVPLGKFEDFKLPSKPKLLNEMHIVIKSEKDGIISESFAQAVIDGLKDVIENAQEMAELSKASDRSGLSNCPQNRADPKQVIDPIVTGY